MVECFRAHGGPNFFLLIGLRPVPKSPDELDWAWNRADHTRQLEQRMGLDDAQYPVQPGIHPPYTPLRVISITKMRMAGIRSYCLRITGDASGRRGHC